MHELGWSSREWLSGAPETNDILQRCVARYHAFMDLLSSSISLFAVPTLDIVSSIQPPGLDAADSFCFRQ